MTVTYAFSTHSSSLVGSTYSSPEVGLVVAEWFKYLLERANRAFETQLTRNEESQMQVVARDDRRPPIHILAITEERKVDTRTSAPRCPRYERERDELQQQLHDIHVRTINPPVDHDGGKATAALLMVREWQPDVTRLAQMFDAYLGTTVCTLVHPCGQCGIRDGVYIRSVCFSPNGQYPATGCEDKKIGIWKLQTRGIYLSFTYHTDQFYSLTFAPDSRLLGSGSSVAKVYRQPSFWLVVSL
ncbi:WD40 repeat protein [Metarhizium acridum CQMa 102]|uniref:WD40 repeat protein n=1 Tax=Metarhizium acridum (strain CQMa 102) TaxID=655827 RepID=E9DZ05_METAQ|nr:WD40 repeat protein [Metarhizium acridum CQMa 102]EFY91182.1 WD40 repeat protein [Metarhizium acridum CQMa 102]